MCCCWSTAHHFTQIIHTMKSSFQIIPTACFIQRLPSVVIQIAFTLQIFRTTLNWRREGKSSWLNRLSRRLTTKKTDWGETADEESLVLRPVRALCVNWATDTKRLFEAYRTENRVRKALLVGSYETFGSSEPAELYRWSFEWDCLVGDATSQFIWLFFYMFHKIYLN